MSDHLLAAAFLSVVGLGCMSKGSPEVAFVIFLAVLFVVLAWLYNDPRF